jgi:hypothetical protein
MKLTTGQSKKEKEFLMKIQHKNATRKRLPRGGYVEKSH